MKGLREMLLQEEARLEKLLKKVETELRAAPKGSLHLSSSNDYVQYYHHFPGQEKRGEYLSKKETPLISQLAQKGYDEKLRRLLRHRLRQIKSITKDYEDEEIEQIFNDEHRERKKLIRPVEPTWNQRLASWKAEEYIGKSFPEGAPAIYTEQGERVRSKSEKILADMFFHKGIAYKYECPLYLNGIGFVHPDFTFLSRRTGQELYWEHHGRMDDLQYAEKTIQKIHSYEENNIFPGEKLILTFETAKSPLDTRLAEKLAEKYLL